MRWWKARKKPVEVFVREVEPKENFSTKKGSVGETIETKNGKVIAICGRDFIIKGINGELYPIDKKIFYKTYDILGEVSKE